MNAISLPTGLPLPRSEALLEAVIEAAERGWIPDILIRAGIRRITADRLADESATGTSGADLAKRLRTLPIAVETGRANEQHYEVPPEFFEMVLGRRLKYSCAYFPGGIADLDAAEEAMLELTLARAGIEDGMDVLDLGCGWGSFTLWLAERQPHTRIVAVSNSAPQGRFIAERAARAGRDNVRVTTADVNTVQFSQRFDRVVSIEMFEHVRNHARLMARIREWLHPAGRLFVHIFCHRNRAYLYETDGAANWMARNFFTGGIMPSADLLEQFQDDLRLEERWWQDGTHYARTADAWLANLDARRAAVAAIFSRAGSSHGPAREIQRWRMFFLACSELFGFAGGSEWGVGHYRFARD